MALPEGAGGGVLALNAGSSSLKFALFDATDTALWRGRVTGLGHQPQLTLDTGGESRSTPLAVGDRSGQSAQTAFDRDFEAALMAIDGLLSEHGAPLLAVGHRVVHGGGEYSAPLCVDNRVLQHLERWVALAPLHEPYGLALIRAMRERYPAVPQIASFDTAFHTTQPRLETLFALPRELTDAGIRRYGFHGLSYEYVAAQLEHAADPRLHGRVVVAHLGQGASLCAMRGLRSVATTMGFSALDGLPMGRRCGSLDAGVVLHLLQQRGMSADEVQHLLYERSGLLGVSGVSDDLRDLLASSDPHAREAVDLFVHRINQWLGALVATLGGLDALVFTGGIGENSALVRAAVCGLSAWLGVCIDEQANHTGADWLHTADSAVAVGVVHTDEESVVARHARACVAAQD